MNSSNTHDFANFLSALKDPASRTILSPTALAKTLGVSIQELASVARVHSNVLSLTPTSPKLQDAMTDIVRVLSAAHTLSGDIERALFWFRNQPIADFHYFTPIQLVKQGEVQALVDYIESIGAGPAG